MEIKVSAFHLTVPKLKGLLITLPLIIISYSFFSSLLLKSVQYANLNLKPRLLPPCFTPCTGSSSLQSLSRLLVPLNETRVRSGRGIRSLQTSPPLGIRDMIYAFPGWKNTAYQRRSNGGTTTWSEHVRTTKAGYPSPLNPSKPPFIPQKHTSYLLLCVTQMP